MIKIELKLDPKKDKRRINQCMWNALAIVSSFRHSPNSVVKCTKICFPTATTNDSSGGSGQKNGQIYRKWRPCKEVHVIQAANGWTHYRIWSKWNYWKRATQRQAGGQSDKHRAIEKYQKRCEMGKCDLTHSFFAFGGGMWIDIQICFFIYEWAPMFMDIFIGVIVTNWISFSSVHFSSM